VEALDRPGLQGQAHRIVELYDMAEAGETVVICLDKLGPLSCIPARRQRLGTHSEAQADTRDL
jgi:hypothetical protein